jgi:diphthamide biosynthesis enzyme Dph1/Dph2-like protein
MVFAMLFCIALFVFALNDKTLFQLKLEGKYERVFVLGDTSYGSCCVDEVAGHHLNADCIVHYGRTCLRQAR